MSKDLVVKEAEIKDLAMFAVEEGQEEHLSQEELELPFLRVAQKGSPQTNPKKPEYIEGLKAGEYFNTVSGSNYGDTLKVQVHCYFHNFTIWAGEKGNGEFRGTMTKDEFKKFSSENVLTKDGGDMVHTVDGETLRYTDTHNFLVSLPEHEDDGIMLYPLSSTGIKAARKLNTLQNGRRINGKVAKRWATLWEFKTDYFEKNGFDWMQTSKIKSLGWVTPELAEYGKSFEDFAASVKDTGVKYSSESSEEMEEDSDF